ncbi:MAG TPA: hypothetical protein VNI52_03975 [Sphingobacteriaceae bacterium]|nr:hypothetical protein [Sphingobacteriaceae bacterium]
MKAVQKTAIKYFYIEDESSRAVQQVPQSLAYFKKVINERRSRMRIGKNIQ